MKRALDGKGMMNNIDSGEVLIHQSPGKNRL